MAASKTTNSGTTWMYYQITATDGIVRDLVVDYTNSNVIYAGGHVSSSARVYRTTDSGANWVMVSSGISGDSVCALAMDPTNNSILYAAATSGIYKTTNSGSSWTYVGLNDARAIVVRPDSPAILYAGTGTGVFESSTGGSSWIAINEGLDNTDVTALALNNNVYLYAGTNGSSIYRITIPVGIEEYGRGGYRQRGLTVTPNPIHGRAEFSYFLPACSSVQLALYDVQGRLISVLANEKQNAGEHVHVWDARDETGTALAEGIYFCKLESGGQTTVQKLIIVQ